MEILKLGWEAFDRDTNLPGAVDVLTMVVKHAVTTLLAGCGCSGAGLFDELSKCEVFLQSQLSIPPASIERET
jgi:hypothetical protein